MKGKSVGLNEPGILNSLVKAGPRAAPLLGPTLDLLSRPFVDGETVVVKPSNYANRLIGAILRARTRSKAVLMTTLLPAFLSRVARKGMLGRLWGRQVLLEAYDQDGCDLGIDMRAIAAMSDLQAAGLGWLLNQRMFRSHLRGSDRARLRSLRGDRFHQDPTTALMAAAAFFGLDFTSRMVGSITEGPVFRTHSKVGGDFEATEAASARHAAHPMTEQEIAHVDTWIASLAGQAGIEMPPGQTLF